VNPVQNEGRELIIEQNLAASLKGITIDVDETPEGNKLVIASEPSK